METKDIKVTKAFVVPGDFAVVRIRGKKSWSYTWLDSEGNITLREFDPININCGNILHIDNGNLCSGSVAIPTVRLSGKLLNLKMIKMLLK